MDPNVARILDRLPQTDPLIAAKAIENRIAALADELNARYPDGVSIISVMTGAMPFTADLIRQLTVPVQVSVVVARSYEGTAQRNGELKLRLPPEACAVTGQHVLVVDDILDSGQTLGRLFADIRAMGPASLAGCVLLRKERPDITGRIEMDYVGFDIPDAFVVGYGLDYDGLGRNLPAIYALPGGA